ncbi:hypothetical protein [Phaffia rhodozyma]|uniref:Uncharacterized protein n=1 Tax=Phaffia rhodozyma TaxID=264483 RepID=A0A0F7SQH0_PHARH|nr:hypothetical protein [Phaffia rhodozyma]
MSDLNLNLTGLAGLGRKTLVMPIAAFSMAILLTTYIHFSRNHARASQKRVRQSKLDELADPITVETGDPSRGLSARQKRRREAGVDS